MSTILLRIKANCKKLPTKDLKYADKFIAKRDFESLLEIVDSDITKLNRKRNADGLFDNEEDAELDMSYRELAGDILSYIRCIEPDFDNDFHEENDDTNQRFDGEDFDW